MEERKKTEAAAGMEDAKEKGGRINLALDGANLRFVRDYAAAKGWNLTRVCNEVIRRYREEHQEAIRAALELQRQIDERT